MGIILTITTTMSDRKRDIPRYMCNYVCVTIEGPTVWTRNSPPF
jgi:hypothetical protein